MSYSIYIGEAILVTDYEEDTPAVRVRVMRKSLPEAPSFVGDASHHENLRSPGYSAWREWCETVGLYDLFYNEETGLMREHPGTFMLQPAHLHAIRTARAIWQEQHPGVVPGWNYDPELSPRLNADAVDDGVRNRDPILARLLWLEWWVDYALKTCTIPAISNT